MLTTAPFLYPTSLVLYIDRLSDGLRLSDLDAIRGVAEAEPRSVHCETIFRTMGLIECLPAFGPLLRITSCCEGSTNLLVAVLKLLATLVDSHDDELGTLADDGKVSGLCAAVFGAAQACFDAVAENAAASDAHLSTLGASAAELQKYRRARALLRLCTAFWPRAAICDEKVCRNIVWL